MLPVPEEAVVALDEEGISVTVAPSSAAGEAIPAADALRVALARFGLPGGVDPQAAAKRGTALVLVRFTDRDQGTEQPDGTIHLRYENELAWLFTIPQVRFGIHWPKRPGADERGLPRW